MPRPSLPPDLEPIDIMLQRWAGEGSLGPRTWGLNPLERMRLEKEGALFGRTGDIPTPSEFFVLDEIIRTADLEVRSLLVLWYSSPLPVVTKARRIGISRADIYNRWKQALRYVQGGMRAKGAAILA